ncbi:MAG TPA: holo-ACP synthase [Gemmatimonadales bacterium]|nr:holo-ACP synthase [Gemmatimonadales bacterium]
MSVVGVGIDLVDIARMEAMLARLGDRLLARLLTDRERAYVVAKYSPARHLAARVAAKEATYKALQGLLGSRGIGWREMEVVPDGAGRPAMVLHGLAARLAAEQGPLVVHLSLSHSDRTAGAVAVAERRGAADPGD